MLVELASLEELDINIDNLKSYVYEYIQPRKDFYKTRSCNLYLESEFTEWWIEKASCGIHVGAGRYPIDVISDNSGIDVLSVCINKNISNEKSMIQIFKGDSAMLDTSFKDGKYHEIVDLFSSTLKEKICKCLNDRKLDNIYYVAFISTKTDIYCFALKIQHDYINNLQPLLSKCTKTSIILENVIDDKYGSSKIYKSKKRMEIRFKRDILSNEKVIKLFNLADPVLKQSDARPV